MAALSHGMNIEQVEELGRYLKDQAVLLEQMTAEIHRRTTQAQAWKGSRADRFRGAAWPQHRTRLSQLARDLDGFGQSALNNAAEQRQASGETGAAGGGSPSSAGGGGPSPLEVIGLADDLYSAASGGKDLFEFMTGPFAFARGAEMAKAGELATSSKIGAAFWGLGILSSASQFSDAWDGDDTAEKWKKGVGGAVAVGSVIPHVGVAKFIWDADYVIADATVSTLDRTGALGGTDDHLTSTYRALYGTDRPSKEQLDHFSGRYRGFWGNATYVSDLVDYNRERVIDKIAFWR